MANVVEVTDREGWRKVYPLQKAIIHIGTAAGNDIVLEGSHGGGIAARHIQLIGGVGGQGYRLINMSEGEIALGDSGRSIPPRSFAEVTDGLSLRVGDFVLIFRTSGMAAPAVPGAMGGAMAATGPGGSAPTLASGGGPIGLSLTLPTLQLGVGQSIEGTVLIRNLGDKAGAQFKIQVEGLESDWFEIGPSPVLFPGASKEVEFRISHPGKPKPGAGEHRFIVRATAPAAYPGQSATLTQSIQILPVFSHRLRLIVE